MQITVHLVPICFHILSPKSAFWKKSGLKLRLVKPKTQLFDKSCVLGIGQKRELNVEILWTSEGP